jgi:hypothetical protein
MFSLFCPLPVKKLSGAIDQLVDEKWWIDKDKIRAKLDNEDQN